MADSRKIVVGVDGSRAGVVAALWAASVADKVGCPIRIVHVLPEDLYRVSAEMVIKQGAVIARKRDAARAIVDDAVAAVGQRHPNISSSGTIVAGPTSTALARVGRDAQMIVLGHPRGLDGPMSALSIAADVASRASCPVLVRRGPSWQYPDNKRPVVLGVDADGSSEQAVMSAFEYADRFGAPIRAVHAHLPDDSDRDRTLRRADASSVAGEGAMPSVDAFVAARHRFPKVQVTQEVARVNHRAHALAAGSVDAQLLVVGTHGRGRVTETLYRSTTHRLVGHSPCPILICPTDLVVGDSARADRPTADPVDE